MHGNAWQWFQEVYGEKDNKDIDEFNNKDILILSFRSFGAEAKYVRAAFRHRLVPAGRYLDVGFRVARTYH
jgi:formylglycine-generating enzyme required for sulfatase activity